MYLVIPNFTVIATNGSRILGGFDLETAKQVAQEVELRWGLDVIKIEQAGAAVLEDGELQTALDEIENPSHC